MASNKLRVAILGASGYTGAELVRLLARHPQSPIVAPAPPTARPASRSPRCFRISAGTTCRPLIKIDDADWAALDLVFCGLPHGTTQEVIAEAAAASQGRRPLGRFPAADLAAYATWYGHAHQAPELQKEAVYGLTEIKRDAMRRRAARRQSRLLSDRLAAAADPAARGRADRSRGHHHRRQVGRQRRGARRRRRARSSPRWPRASTPTASPATATRPRSSRACARRRARRSWSTSRRI